ncbi:dehydrin ERD14-like [Silene latifolia]|uniref:dehydrin ERD14-like n=1 Tax=Silene latifolia TaxID=37657 RepID=UPI003D787190
MSNPYPTGFQTENPEAPATERSLFDCFGKKEGDEDVPAAGGEHEPSLMDKLHRSNSSSSSSSEEEVEEGGMKIQRRKKKEKLPSHKNEGAGEIQPEEKKGFLEKIKDKLPGHHKDEAIISPAHAATMAPPHCPPDGHCGGVHEQQEKKGIFEKIKEKLPGGHKDVDETNKD